MFFSLISLSLLCSLPSEADSVGALLRRADRLIREGTDTEAKEALQSVYDAIVHINPSDPMLLALQTRLDRYAPLTTGAVTDFLSLTQEDRTYLSIENAWREGRFWQAKRELNALLGSLGSPPIASMTSARSALSAECWYLQGEMECLQRDWPAAYRAYTQARGFSQSTYAPWYSDALVKSMYCLLMSEQGCGSFASRLDEVERLMTHPALSSKQHACLVDAMQVLKVRPCARQNVQEWVKQVVGIMGPFFSFPEVYANRDMQTFPDGLYLADHLHVLMCSALQRGDLEKAAEWKNLLEQRCPNSPKCAEACFCLARDAEERGDAQSAYLYYREGTERFPESPFAAESAFLSYPYQDYVEGKAQALEHLKSLEQRFSHSRYALFSRYVRALHELYYADPLLAFEDLKELLEYAQLLQESGELQEKECEEVAALMAQALYEKAKACLAVARQAIGAKKSLFLALAQESYQKLISPSHVLPAPLKGECYMALAEIAECRGDATEACKLLETLLHELDTHDACQHVRARAYYTLGRLCAHLHEHEAALEWLKMAKRDAVRGNLSAEERLDLFFLQSQLHRKRGEWEEAMKSLSDVVNDPSVSKRRFEALYERAELFCERGCTDCAKRQWEALLLTEGPFAEKAKKRLEEER